MRHFVQILWDESWEKEITAAKIVRKLEDAWHTFLETKLQMGEESAKMREFLQKLTMNAIGKVIKMAEDHGTKTQDSEEQLKAALYVTKMMNVKEMVVASFAPDGFMATYEPYQCLDRPLPVA